MKLYLIVLAISFCGSILASRATEENCDYDDNLNLVGLQESDKEIIYRPCDLRDWDCIREFFAKNSPCSITKGLAPDPLIFERITVNIPITNITVIFKSMQTSGLNNAKVKEFYVNKYTGNVVFAIDIMGMSERSSSTSFRYLRTGKEPIVLTDYLTITFNRITYTAVIPKVPHLQLHKADIHADIADSNPTMIIGPKAYNSSDPVVQRSYSGVIANLPRALREALLLKTSVYVTTFIQSNICDFGQDVIAI